MNGGASHLIRCDTFVIEERAQIEKHRNNVGRFDSGPLDKKRNNGKAKRNT